jgi:hypothetical protein
MGWAIAHSIWGRQSQPAMALSNVRATAWVSLRQKHGLPVRAIVTASSNESEAAIGITFSTHPGTNEDKGCGRSKVRQTGRCG